MPFSKKASQLFSIFAVEKHFTYSIVHCIQQIGNSVSSVANWKEPLESEIYFKIKRKNDKSFHWSDAPSAEVQQVEEYGSLLTFSAHRYMHKLNLVWVKTEITFSLATAQVSLMLSYNCNYEAFRDIPL